MFDLIGKTAPTLLESGSLGAVILILSGFVIGLALKVNALQKALVASHEARIADFKSWNDEKVAIIKEQIEADHEVATSMKTIATAFDAVKDVVGGKRR
jgi:hypothetical protein